MNGKPTKEIISVERCIEYHNTILVCFNEYFFLANAHI